MDTKDILFVRHAESRSNAGFATKDAYSIPLSPRGIVQAENLAKNFPIVPELIVVSSYIRTQETAEPLISKLDNVKVEVWDTVHEFTYLDREKYKDTTSLERRKYVYEYWDKKDPFFKDGPQEESFFDLLKRAEKFIEEVRERKEKKIAIFSHKQFLLSLRLIAKLNTKVDLLVPARLTALMTDLKELIEIFPVGNAEIFTWEELLGS